MPCDGETNSLNLFFRTNTGLQGMCFGSFENAELIVVMQMLMILLWASANPF